jgi:hypothetical protein
LLPIKDGSSLIPSDNKLLLLRREWKGGPLLLKVLNEEPIVRYHFDTERSEKSDLASWQSATEPVTVCGGSFSVAPEEEVTKYDTYGKYALDGAYSASNARLAIISAYGPKMPSFSLIPGLGGGRNIWGQRYLEAKNGQPPFANLRKPIRMADDWSQSLCWTGEEDAVIYYSRHYFSWFSVLSLSDKTVTEKPSTEGAPTVSDQASPDLSRFTGNFRDYGIDSDGDGLFEKIVIEVETQTSIPGQYSLSVSLTATNGKTAARGTEAELKGGTEWTRVVFDAEEWFEKGIDGALSISRARLEYGLSIDIDEREDLGRTREYSQDQFKRDSVIYTGEQSYKLVDPDKQGKFRGLEFTIGVDVLRGGEYRYQSDLYFETWSSTAGGSVDFIMGSVKLKKGRNLIPLRYSGRAILKYGKPGKLQLRNFVLGEKGERGKWLNEGMFTQPFDLSEFSPEWLEIFHLLRRKYSRF